MVAVSDSFAGKSMGSGDFAAAAGLMVPAGCSQAQQDISIMQAAAAGAQQDISWLDIDMHRADCGIIPHNMTIIRLKQ